MEEKIYEILVKMQAKMEETNERLVKMEANMEELGERLIRVEGTVNRIETSQTEDVVGMLKMTQKKTDFEVDY